MIARAKTGTAGIHHRTGIEIKINMDVAAITPVRRTRRKFQTSASRSSLCSTGSSPLAAPSRIDLESTELHGSLSLL